MLLRRLGLACVLIILGVAPARAQSAAELVDRWVSAIEASPQWAARHEGLASEDGGRTAIAGKVTIVTADGGKPAMQIVGLRVSDVTATAEGGVRIGRLTWESGEFQLAEPSGTRLEGLEVTDLVLPAMPALDAANLPGLLAALASAATRTSFSRATAKSWEFAADPGNGDHIVTLDRFRAEGLAGGVLASAGADMLLLDNLDQTIATQVREPKFRGFDLGGLAYALGEPNGARWHRLLDEASFDVMEDKRWGIAKVSIEGVGLRTLARVGGASVPPAFDPWSWIGALRAGKITAVDAVSEEPRLRLGNIELRGVSADGIEAAELGRSTFTSPDNTVRIGTASLAGLRLPAIAVLKLGAEGKPVDGLPLIERMPALADFAVRDLTIDASRGGRMATVRAFTARLRDYVGAIPTSARFDYDGSQPIADAFADFFLGLGYREFSSTMSFGWEWNEAAGTVRFSDAGLKVRDVGRAEYALVFGGFTRERLINIEELDTDLLSFHSFRLALSDVDLLRRAIAKQAKDTGQREPDVAEQFGALTAVWVATARDVGALQRFVPAIRAFISNPSKLEIIAEPAAPVSFGEIREQRSPEENLRLFGVDVKGP